MNNEPTRKVNFTPYEIFVVLVSLLSIFNIVLYFVFEAKSILYVIGTIDTLISFIFLIDFIRNFHQAESKYNYFFKGLGFADLLASIPLPQFKILRLLRIIKVYKEVRKGGVRLISQGIFKNTASAALYLVFFIILLLLEFGSIAVLYAEQNNPESNINTASDAIWWVYVTITTVGYGDKYPVTNVGRLIGMVVMLVGVGLFGVLTGFLANKFLPKDNELYDKLDTLKEEIKNLKNENKK
jgi:voltage-gated potassium channel Kch